MMSTTIFRIIFDFVVECQPRFCQDSDWEPTLTFVVIDRCTLLLTIMFADIIFAEDIDFIVIMMMMVQCQPLAFTFILLPIYCCRGQWNYKYVCPLPSHQESLLGPEASPESPDDLELLTIPRMTVIRSHSLLKWSQECRNSENFSKPRGEE